MATIIAVPNYSSSGNVTLELTKNKWYDSVTKTIKCAKLAEFLKDVNDKMIMKEGNLINMTINVSEL